MSCNYNNDIYKQNEKERQNNLISNYNNCLRNYINSLKRHINSLKRRKMLIKLHIIKDQIIPSGNIDMLNNKLNDIEQEMLDTEKEISKLSR